MTDRPPTAFEPLQALTGPAQQAMEYWVDGWQRTILFWDVLRRRSDAYYEQRAKPVPHVLSFDAELVLDGRTFERPVNYLLVRIKPPAGVRIDPKKRPFVVVDPRAGHGPGIGGFKADSELGVAMRAGHPAYFVGFTPEPDAGPDDRRHHARRGDLPREGHRAAPRGRRQAVRDRQLPGRLGGDDAGRDPAGAVRPAHHPRLAAVLLGRRRGREPDALHRRRCSAAAG